MPILPVLAIAAGLVLLIWSADRFVGGASAAARLLGVSPLVVGVLIVGFGTSAPEMLVSGIAAAHGNGGLSIGNALGSNITNIGLILGITAIIYPLQVRSRIIRRELPILMATMVVGLVLMSDGTLDRVNGSLLLVGLVVMVGWSLREVLSDRGDVLASEYAAELPPQRMTLAVALGWVLVGLLVLIGSSRLLVYGAVEIAHRLGISDLVIGLTIVAIGTSLPELAASLTAAKKGEHDIAIGNVAGSNMFNLLGVMALPALLDPGPFDPEVLRRDFPVMLLLTVLLQVFASNYTIRKQGTISRLEGGVLIAVYLVYLTALVYEAVGGKF